VLNRLAEGAVCEHSIILWQRDDGREAFLTKFEKKRKEAGYRFRRARFPGVEGVEL
jgi:hypothetical protein